MDFVWGKLRDFCKFSEKARVEEKKREISKFEGYLGLAYKVLSWEDNSLTLTVFLVLNFIFWLVIQLELRPFGLFFLTALAAFLADYFITFDFNTQTIHLDAIDELRNDINDFIISLKAFRKNSSGPFCVAMAMFFLGVSFFAQHISTYLILYLSLLAVFFIPLIVSQLPPQYVNNVKQFIRTIGTERGVLAEEELIPFISDKDFNHRDADLDSLLTNKTADSGNNSLISETMAMPSYLDADDRESLQEDDLIPNLGQRTADDLSSDSDSDHKGIRFESGHFNGDSSSEDENRYSKDLNFSHDTVDQNRVVAAAAVASTASNALTTLMEAWMPKSKPDNRPRQDSSSDSDFEYVTELDFIDY